MDVANLNALRNEPSKQTQDETFIKIEAELVPVYKFYDHNSEEIAGLIERRQTYKYDDIELSFSTFPMPLDSTSSGLIKREGDLISGQIPFNQSVCFSF